MHFFYVYIPVWPWLLNHFVRLSTFLSTVVSHRVVVNIMQDKKDFFGSPPGMD